MLNNKNTNSSSNLSAQTEALLNGYMKKSGLSIAQQKLLLDRIKGHQPLPQPTELNRTVTPKCRQPRNASAIPIKLRFENPRPVKKTFQQIVNETQYYRTEKFRGGLITVSREKKIAKLQTLMSGETVDQDNPSRLKPRETRQLLSPDLEEYDEYNALVDEIRERLDWLDEMKELGAGKKYESQIRSEVSLRMSRLEQLQRRSTTETSKKEGPGIYT